MNEKPLPEPQKNTILEETSVLFDNIVTNAYLKSLKDCDILPLEEFLLKERSLQLATLDIKERYGKNAILKGTDFLEGATTRERNRQVGGHKA